MTSEVMDSGFHFSDTTAQQRPPRFPRGQHNEKERFEPVVRGVVVGLRFGVVVERWHQGSRGNEQGPECPCTIQRSDRYCGYKASLVGYGGCNGGRRCPKAKPDLRRRLGGDRILRRG